MSLLDLLQEYNVEYRQKGESPHVSDGWIGIECPYCGCGTGKFGLGLREDSGAASCWKCGKHSLVEVLHELTGVGYRELRGQLNGLLRLSVPEGPRRGKYRVPDAVGPLGVVHRNYLRSRAYDPDELVRIWDLGGIGLHPRLAWRIFLPVHDAAGRPGSWTSRRVYDPPPEEDAGLRYVSARPEEEATPLKSLLYGAHLCGHTVIVVEGPTDVWRIGPGAVATFGLVVTTAQRALLATFPRRAVCFDSEPEAQRRASELCNWLAPFPGRTERVELDAKDPGEADEREIKLLRKVYLE